MEWVNVAKDFSETEKLKVKVKLSLCLTKHHLHAFLTSELDGGGCRLHVPAALPQGKSPQYPMDRRPGEWMRD
jgi:hypothetical protein